MITLSATLQAALDAHNPQRFLIEFADANGSYANPTVFSNEDIAVNRGVRLNAMFNAEKELTIGSCPSAEISFTLLNDRQQLVDFSFGECKAWIGARIDSGAPTMKTKTFAEGGETVTYEFAPLGIFKVTRPDVVVGKMIDVSGNDRMIRFEEELPASVNDRANFPMTIGQIASALCTAAGVPLATTTFLNSTLEVASRPKQFEARTMREVLRWVAEAAGGFAVINRSGELEIRWFQATSRRFEMSNYKEFTPSWYKVKQVTALKVRNQEETDEHSYGSGGNAYVITGNPFLR